MTDRGNRGLDDSIVEIDAPNGTPRSLEEYELRTTGTALLVRTHGVKDRLNRNIFGNGR